MAPWPVIVLGATGEDVRTIQLLLAAHGHPVAVDAQYSPITRAAVQAFQGAAGLAVDGTVGPATWEAVIVTLATGASGPAVRALQSQLRSQGWRLAVDGAFGPQTDRSVRDLQTARHLSVDGVAGPKTWSSLVAGFERLATPEAAANHLMEAWAAGDRRTALGSATQAAVDLLLRGQAGGMAPMGCSPDPVLGSGHFSCSWTYPGGAVDLAVRGDPLTGYYVESASFVVD